MLRLVVLAGAVAATADGKASVKVYMEFGCKHCRRYMTGPLRAALENSEVANSMELEVNPFGNSFYAIKECENASTTNSSVPGCGGDGGYDSGKRSCFNRKCGPDGESVASEREQNCFKGPLIYQFGFQQMYTTRFAICAMKQAMDDWRKYVQYLICIEDKFDDIHDGSSSGEVAKACATKCGLNSDELNACYSSRAPDLAMRDMALATPQHSGVPWITVNGAVQKEDYETGVLVEAVRKAAMAKYSAAARTALAQVSRHVGDRESRYLRARSSEGTIAERWTEAANYTC